MKRLIYFAISLILSIPTLANHQGFYSLREAIERAVRYDAQVIAAKEQLQQSQQAFYGAISSAFPALTAELDANYLKAPVGTTGTAPFGGEPYNQYVGQLKLVQPLYRGGAIMGAYRFADLQRSINEFRIEEISRAVSIRVLQEYLNTLLAKRRLEGLREVEKVENEGLALTIKREKNGRSQRLDVLQSRTVLALLGPKIAQAEDDLKIAAAQLARDLHLKDEKWIELEGESLSELPVDRLQDEITRLAQKKSASSHPTLEKLKVQNIQFDYEREIELSKHYPQLNLLGNYGRTTNRKVDLFDDQFTGWSVGLQLSIPIFTGLSSVSDRKSLSSKKRVFDLQVYDAEEQQGLQEIQAAQTFETAKAMLKSTRSAHQLATESLKEAQNKYRVSTLDYAQFLSIQQNYLDAELAYDQAKYNAWVSMSQYFDALGFSQNEVVRLYEESKKGG